jgi:hypothetical protein
MSEDTEELEMLRQWRRDYEAGAEATKVWAEALCSLLGGTVPETPLQPFPAPPAPWLAGLHHAAITLHRDRVRLRARVLPVEEELEAAQVKIAGLMRRLAQNEEAQAEAIHNADILREVREALG